MARVKVFECDVCSRRIEYDRDLPAPGQIRVHSAERPQVWIEVELCARCSEGIFPAVSAAVDLLGAAMGRRNA